ncbi:hypothetical protein [uncultured Prevotella sp.]|uniref:hypothetical protein n=1 Tax=uncultured Prevotella sp. TaxID=159272 RepID=UPI0026030739|nr:hypothetical protein [uncultured Prevotella sp.]
MKDIIVFLFSIILFSSCLVMDHKPLGYWIHNNTEDTLLIDLTESDTLSGGAQWFFSPTDSLILDKDDTVSVCIHGKRKNIFRSYYVLPYSKSGSIYPLPDICYLYVIKWNLFNRYSLEEIREKGLYERRILSKGDFDGHVYEYRK